VFLEFLNTKLNTSYYYGLFSNSRDLLYLCPSGDTDFYFQMRTPPPVYGIAINDYRVDNVFLNL